MRDRTSPRRSLQGADNASAAFGIAAAAADEVNADDDHGHDNDVAAPHAREPALRYAVFVPCYRATPSSTARATSAS
jgi:hypothetical protein